MKVRIKVTSTKENVVDIGNLKPGFIKELVEQDEADGYFMAGTDWSIQEMANGDTVYEITNVEVTEIKGGK